MILRPSAIIQNGDLRHGLEVVLLAGTITEIRPLSGSAEPWVLSAAFVNAHSHLEYRGMLGQIHGEDFPSWIRAITLAKSEQPLEQVRNDCLTAAAENRATGVALIGEHSDRPFAREAMEVSGLDGVIFQELITFNEKDGAVARWNLVREKAEAQRAVISPHAPWTVDGESLRRVSQGDHQLSIHAAESPAEHDLFVSGTGGFADLYARFQIPPPPAGASPIEFLDSVGFLQPRRQLVHCCTASESDLDLMAARGVVVAHCPRSNEALKCPSAPIRAMLDRGLDIGIGLDSCASSGPIDMFAEMRAALDAGEHRGAPLRGAEVWRMATTMGASSLGRSGWDVQEGANVPLIGIDVSGVLGMEDLIHQGRPELVRWINRDVS